MLVEDFEAVPFVTQADALTSPSRVGWHYNTNDGQGPDHTVIRDTSRTSGCVVVQPPAGNPFPLPKYLVDEIAAPPGMTWAPDRNGYVALG